MDPFFVRNADVVTDLKVWPYPATLEGAVRSAMDAVKAL